MTEYGSPPPSLSWYKCEECGDRFTSLASFVRCIECGSSEVRED